MRKVRTISLGVLLAVLLVLSAAPTASAAPVPRIAWYTYGSTLSADSTVDVCSTEASFQRGQTLKIQVARSGVWKTARSYDAARLQGQWCVSARPSELVSRPGTYWLRATTWTAGGAKAEQRIRLTFTRAGVWPDVRTAEYTTTRADRTVRVTLSSAYGQSVDLQRKSGSSWRTVQRVRAPRAGNGVTVRLGVPTRAGTATYRVVSRATSWTATGISSTFSVHQTDTARYGGYIAKARRHIARWCPKTPIHVDTQYVVPGNPYGRIGSASQSWSWEGSGGSYSARIDLRSGMTGDQLRHVAVHECAHVVQGRAVVQGRRDVEERNAWQRYPEVGDEGQADCMAYAIVRSSRHLFYVRGCSASRLRDAERMWQRYGGKYQAATYRW